MTSIQQPTPPNQPLRQGKQKKSGFLSNMIFNIVIPAVILSRFSSEDTLGPVWGVVVALAFPLLFGLWELVKLGKINFYSILGIISVMLTGGISLLQLDPSYIAIKEAMIPAIIGIVVLVSQYTPFPLVKKLLINPDLLDTDKLYQALAAAANRELFEQRVARAGYIVAAAFFVSAVLNYVLAKAIVVSQPGTTAYAEELGRMTWLSYPVIMVPVMVMLMGAITYMFMQIGKLTKQPLEDFILQ
ncbi:MFS transporter [Arsukibacterium sp. MJ3]|uniref:VC0807 family protein n=1 Tax=Arsukibacterium sp. MJ3 TaxID=1632859 RepID=UPI000626EF24|nr:VC0807 family protein [Arsukibacterium sp. MJ3]KKO47806.1 MFS transporter [Arsukibacterium sp. MJ3]